MFTNENKVYEDVGSWGKYNQFKYMAHGDRGQPEQITHLFRPLLIGAVCLKTRCCLMEIINFDLILDLILNYTVNFHVAFNF